VPDRRVFTCCHRGQYQVLKVNDESQGIINENMRVRNGIQVIERHKNRGNWIQYLMQIEIPTNEF